MSFPTNPVNGEVYKRYIYNNGMWDKNEAIVGSGSNTNGNYTKFSDGTLICNYHYESGTVPAIGDAYAWTYPHAFTSKPSVHTTGGFGYADFWTYSAQVVTATTAGCYYRPSGHTTAVSAAGQNLVLSLSAIGRWK